VIAFYFIALLMIASALTVVLHRNPIYSALALVNTLFLVAVAFVMLDAQLIAMLQVIVYAGAIVILFLFVIMLLNVEVEAHSARISKLGTVGLALALLLAVELGIVAVVYSPGTVEAPPPGFGTTEALAEHLFTTNMLSFELTSLLLLVAVVGAVVMARRKVES
jgi:NADH-quinone oxidoreductase subunit J